MRTLRVFGATSKIFDHDDLLGEFLEAARGRSVDEIPFATFPPNPVLPLQEQLCMPYTMVPLELVPYLPSDYEFYRVIAQVGVNTLDCGIEGLRILRPLLEQEQNCVSKCGMLAQTLGSYPENLLVYRLHFLFEFFSKRCFELLLSLHLEFLEFIYDPLELTQLQRMDG